MTGPRPDARVDVRVGPRPGGGDAFLDLERTPARLSTLVAVTSLIYVIDGVALACGIAVHTPGTNSPWMLGSLALVALAFAAYALVRGRRFGPAEATVMLAVQVGSVAWMSHTTQLDLAALGDGFGLAMLGAYTSWLLGRPAAVVAYAGLSLWVAVIAARDDRYLTVSAVLLAGQAAATTEIVRALRRHVRRMTDLDPLTLIFNRRAIEDTARAVVGRNLRRGRPVSIGLIDLDDLREVNNASGHRAGDDLLIEAAEEWRIAFRHVPVTVGRIGGDEFVLIFDGIGEQAARDMLTAISSASEVRWTAGVAQVRPGEALSETLARADAEMYVNKDRKLSPAQP